MENTGFPRRDTAERLLADAEKMNPGPWGNHSRYVALCAERIALACGLDGEKAYSLGLLHDIGRRFGISHLAHVYDGYSYMNRLGYPDAARICLTHSFCCHSFQGYIGKLDVTPAQQLELEAALDRCVFDDYDRLIQLCDSIAGAEGVMGLEKRMNDVRARYGWYPQDKWEKNFALKDYFEEKCGQSLDRLLSDPPMSI